MKIPKVNFVLSDPKAEVNLFYEMLFQAGDFWREHLLKNYPGFGKIKQNIDAKKQIDKSIKRIYKDKSIEIANKLKIAQETWNKINDNFFECVFEILNMSLFPDIRAELTIVPLGTRYPKENRIGIQHWLDAKEFLQVCAHEIIHLCWFKKVLEEFPNTDINSFDDDNSNEWKISEAICPIILNDSRLIKLVGKSDKTSYACGKNLSEKFEEVYKEKESKNVPFKEFYRKLLVELK